MSQVLFIANNPVFRLGLRELIKDSHPDLVVIEAGTFAQAREILKTETEADIRLILLDIGVGDSGGFVGLFQLRTQFTHIPVIVLSDTSDTEMVSRAFAVGAAGYISKISPCGEISQTLSAALANKNWKAVPILTDPSQANPISSLSPAQLRVLKGLKRGLRNKQIAFELGLTENTVKAYMSTLYRRLGVSNRTQALILLQQVTLELQLESP